MSGGGWLQAKGQGIPMLTVSEATELIIHMTQLIPASQTSLPFSSLLAALAGQQLLVRAPSLLRHQGTKYVAQPLLTDQQALRQLLSKKIHAWGCCSQ